MTSETRIACVAGVSRQGSPRPCSSNQARSLSSTRPTLQGQPDPDVCATVGPEPRAGPALVRPRDRLHDRQAEAAAVPGRRRARERLERVVAELRRETGALVEHMQLDARVVPACRDRDRTAAVLERVVDEVPERLLNPQPTA